LDASKDLVTGAGDAVCELLSVGLLVIRLELLLNVLMDGFAAFVGERHVDGFEFEFGVCGVFVVMKKCLSLMFEMKRKERTRRSLLYHIARHSRPIHSAILDLNGIMIKRHYPTFTYSQAAIRTPQGELLWLRAIPIRLLWPSRGAKVPDRHWLILHNSPIEAYGNRKNAIRKVGSRTRIRFQRVWVFMQAKTPRIFNDDINEQGS